MTAIVIILLTVAIFFGGILLLTALFGGMLGPSFNRFNPFQMRSAVSPDPACGNCGYVTRGISTFDCPECGADLREVGIMTTATRHRVGSGCLLPVGYTLLVLVISLWLMASVIRHVPHREVVWMNTGLYPNSHEYREIELAFTVSKTYVPSTQPNAGASSFTGGTQYSGHGGNITAQRTLTWGILKPPAQVESIRIVVMPAKPAQAWRDGVLEIDPQTHDFEWSGLQGSTHHGSAPLTDQDVLAFLTACGADANHRGVQNEAQELFAIIDGLSRGMNNFTLTEFGGPSSMSSYATSSGPEAGWGLGYLAFWLSVWIGGLVWISRRAKRKTAR